MKCISTFGLYSTAFVVSLFFSSLLFPPYFYFFYHMCPVYHPDVELFYFNSLYCFFFSIFYVFPIHLCFSLPSFGFVGLTFFYSSLLYITSVFFLFVHSFFLFFLAHYLCHPYPSIARWKSNALQILESGHNNRRIGGEEGRKEGVGDLGGSVKWLNERKESEGESLWNLGVFWLLLVLMVGGRYGSWMDKIRWVGDRVGTK